MKSTWSSTAARFWPATKQLVFDEIAAVKRVCGDVHVKAILEAGEFGSYDAIRRCSDLALEAGADTIKTSTGKIGVSATLPISLVMCQSIHSFYHRTGERRGFKAAGGIRTSKVALSYLVLIDEVLGGDWLDPDLLPDRRVIAARRLAAAARKRTHRPIPVARHHPERLGDRMIEEQTAHALLVTATA